MMMVMLMVMTRVMMMAMVIVMVRNDCTLRIFPVKSLKSPESCFPVKDDFNEIRK